MIVPYVQNKSPLPLQRQDARYEWAIMYELKMNIGIDVRS